MVVLVQLVVALPVILDAIPSLWMVGDALAAVVVLRWMVGDDSAAVVALVAPPEALGRHVVALVAPPCAMVVLVAPHVCLPLAFSRVELDGRQPSLPHRPSA